MSAAKPELRCSEQKFNKNFPVFFTERELFGGAERLIAEGTLSGEENGIFVRKNFCNFHIPANNSYFYVENIAGMAYN